MVHWWYTVTLRRASWVACPPTKPLQYHRQASHHRPVNHRHTTGIVWQCERVITSECLAPATCNSGLITPSQTSALLKNNLLQARSHSSGLLSVSKHWINWQQLKKDGHVIIKVLSIYRILPSVVPWRLTFLWSPYGIGQTIIFLPCDFFLSFFYSSPNLSGHRLDVYHTFTHGVALVRI